MTDFAYVGSELELFACATTWKSYVRSHLQPYLSGDILEVGAGIGAATATFNDSTQRRWVCLEPDRALADRIKPGLPAKLTNCEIVAGTLSDLGPDQQFDGILYMDVLEHIEADGAELARAARHLKPDGILTILSPALPWLFTPFDTAIGHYRRYTKIPCVRSRREICTRQNVYISTRSDFWRRWEINFFCARPSRAKLRSVFGTASWCRYPGSQIAPLATQ